MTRSAARLGPLRSSARRVLLTALAVAFPVAFGSTAGATGAVTVPDAGEGSPAFYRVEAGDGFFAIASQLGVDVTALLGRNQLPLEYVLQPGFVLMVPEPDYAPPATDAPPAPVDSAAPEDTGDDATDAPSDEPSGESSTPAPQQQQTPAPGTQAPPAPPTSAAPPPPQPSGTGDCVVGGIGWINDARANAGMPALAQGDASSACSWSRQQAEAGAMSHSGNGCGEIVGYSSNSYGDLPGAWLNSPSHYNIVVHPDVGSAAVAYVQNLSTGYWYGTGTFC